MQEFGVHCVRRAVSGAGLTDFGKAACVSLLLVLSCALSPAFAQAFEGDGCTPEMKVKEGSGSEAVPYEIRTLCQLQDISSNPKKHYVLMDNVDASATKDWNGGAGFKPIATLPIAAFSGSFVSTGKHVISSLTINRSGTLYVGLFSRLAKDGKIDGIRLVGSRTTGGKGTGSLVGYSRGSVRDSYASGSVVGAKEVGGLVGNMGLNSDISGSSATGSVSGDNQVGGLVGRSSGKISGSYAMGSVSGVDEVGGLVGLMRIRSDISNSYATGLVSGKDQVGGLVGYLENGSSISGSYATGSVFGAENVGGLVGRNSGDTNNSYATGSVVGAKNVGGFVGSLDSKASITGNYATGSVVGAKNVGGFVGSLDSKASITGNYATGSVSGNDQVGGLVGGSSGVISVSYATGSVSGDDQVGGLVGGSSGVISVSYATGSVSGNNIVGGLVGSEGDGSDIRDSYATGSVSGRGEEVGGLVGQSNGNIANSYYAARGQSNGFGAERTFTQLRCPMVASATCSPPGSDQRTYEDWDTSVWDFGSTTELPQLSSNRNSELNLKPYVKGSADLVVMTGSMGTTQFSLVADYLGPSGEFVILTWSLSGVPTSLRHLVYFDLEGGTTSTTFTDSRKRTDGASKATLVVVGNAGLAGKSFHVVLKSNVSANDDRIRVRIEEEKPYIRPDEDIRLAPVEGITTFSFSVGYAGPAEQPVTLTWSLSDVPTALSHLVYLDLGNDTTGTTVTDSGKLTGTASLVTLVVVGNMAGRSFYVVLKNNVSANDDRVRVQVEVEPPNILGDDDIRPALVGRTSIIGFSVGYTGSSVPVTLTWSLEDVPTALRDLVYFDLGGGKYSTAFTDPSVLTSGASPVTLVVVGNEEPAGNIFYVVLKNNISANVDRIPVRTEVGPPNILGDDDIRPALVGRTSFISFSVGYTGSPVPVTLMWSIEDAPPHLVYFDLGGGKYSTAFTDPSVLTSGARKGTLVVVGDEELSGRSFYVVLKNNISADVARVMIQVRKEDSPNILGDNDRPVPIGRTTTFSFSVGYTGSAEQPVTLTWSLEDVPTTQSHLVYFDLAGNSTSTTFTDPSVFTSGASPATLVVVGNKELAGKDFYVVLRNNISADVARVTIRVRKEDSPALTRPLRVKVYLGGAVR